jgi:hypothetical protein
MEREIHFYNILQVFKILPLFITSLVKCTYWLFYIIGESKELLTHSISFLVKLDHVDNKY